MAGFWLDLVKHLGEIELVNSVLSDSGATSKIG